MCGSGKWQDVGYLRVDKITNIHIIDEPIVPLSNIKGYEKGIDFKKISCSLPFMFGDEVKAVTFIADISVIDYIFDTFGNDISIFELENGKLEVTVKASLMAMEYWALQYLNCVEIKSPESLREKIKEDIKSAQEKYNR